jgi:hypothetical protein
MASQQKLQPSNFHRLTIANGSCGGNFHRLGGGPTEVTDFGTTFIGSTQLTEVSPNFRRGRQKLANFYRETSVSLWLTKDSPKPMKKYFSFGIGLSSIIHSLTEVCLIPVV